jgi:hypothetical protein
VSEPKSAPELVRDATTEFVIRSVVNAAGASVRRFKIEGFTGVLITPLSPLPFSGRKLLRVLPVPDELPQEMFDTAEVKLQELLAVSGVEYTDIRENGRMGVFFYSFDTTQEACRDLIGF